MKWVPFTLHIRITPANPGKRFEYIRDMQKIASMAYSGLSALDNTIYNFASPSGGQQRSYSTFNKGALGGLSHGCAVKPQIGETPAQLQITGFHRDITNNNQTYPALMRLHAGEVVTGPGSHSYDSTPSDIVDTGVKTLKNAVESVLTAALPPGVNYDVFRIDYSGVVYGDRGYHFPR